MVNYAAQQLVFTGSPADVLNLVRNVRWFGIGNSRGGPESCELSSLYPNYEIENTRRVCFRKECLRIQPRGEEMPLCPKCERVCYCSDACREADEAEHQDECKTDAKGTAPFKRGRALPPLVDYFELLPEDPTKSTAALRWTTVLCINRIASINGDSAVQQHLATIDEAARAAFLILSQADDGVKSHVLSYIGKKPMMRTSFLFISRSGPCYEEEEVSSIAKEHKCYVKALWSVMGLKGKCCATPKGKVYNVRSGSLSIRQSEYCFDDGFDDASDDFAMYSDEYYCVIMNGE